MENVSGSSIILGFGNGDDIDENDDLVGTGIVEINRVFDEDSSHTIAISQAVFSVCLVFSLFGFSRLSQQMSFAILRHNVM